MEDVQTTIAFSQQREDPLIDMYVCRKVASQINNTSGIYTQFIIYLQKKIQSG